MLGAAGFTGRAVTRALVTRGVAVRAFAGNLAADRVADQAGSGSFSANSVTSRLNSSGSCWCIEWAIPGRSSISNV